MSADVFEKDYSTTYSYDKQLKHPHKVQNPRPQTDSRISEKSKKHNRIQFHSTGFPYDFSSGKNKIKAN